MGQIGSSHMGQIGSSLMGQSNSYHTVDIGDTRTSEDLISNRITGICRVEDDLRRCNEEAYKPQVISIGPFHNQIYSERLQNMQGLKEEYSKCFWQRVTAGNRFNVETPFPTIKEQMKRQIGNFWQWVTAGNSFNVETPFPIINEQMMRRIREFYRGTIMQSDAELSKLVLVDASFILELFLRSYSETSRSKDPMLIECELRRVTNDLLLLENQLPFWLLEEVFKYVPGKLSVRQLTFAFFKVFNVQDISHEDPNVKIEHFTDLLRTFLLPQSHWPSSTQLPQRGDVEVKLLYSATQMQEAGIKFKMSSNKCLTGLKFENGVLEIPQFKFKDATEALIRNIMALEQACYTSNEYVTHFFVFLDFLANTTEDMELLCGCGIVNSFLGDCNAATQIVNNLRRNNSWVGLSTDYCELCKRLNAFCEDPRNKWKAILKRDYFSTPWRIVSTVAVAVLFVLTFIQTVCSILQVL